MRVAGRERPARPGGTPAGLGEAEFAVTSGHAVALDRLPPIHRDPFDRILVAQAETEGAALLTADPVVARYGPAVRSVG